MHSPSEKSTMMFATLVSMLSSQAMLAMGKIANPMTGAVERNLPAAQLMIDMVEMMLERTAGNLTEEESRLISSTLSDLRLNYVYEVNRDVNPSSPSAAQTAVAAEDGTASAEAIPEGVASEHSSSDDGVPPNVA